MKEIKFLHSNIKKWKEFEGLLDKNQLKDPDRLYTLYITLTDDLAYARTYYPDGESYAYLNQLTQRVHSIIYSSKPVSTKKFLRFWKKDYPLLFHSLRKEFFISLAIFSISVLIGVLSTTYQPEFARAILGDRYVNMTMANIENADPMAVYKDMNEVNMFLGITYNNIKVSFLAFLSGILSAFGTGLILLSNGVMLGTFHTFLAQHGIVTEAFATVWIHGTIEIFSIILAGAAGILIGNSLVFPGTYKRIFAFRRAAQKGARLIVGTIPLFVIAGFLEGFITRHTELPYAIRFGIIGLSLSFLIFYFFLYPIHLTKNKTTHARK